MNEFQIEIIYPLPNEQVLLTLMVDQTCTAAEAIEKSGILQQYPEIDLTTNQIGIFSRTIALSDTLREGDRIEIYRPLIVDPKEMRKRKRNRLPGTGIWKVRRIPGRFFLAISSGIADRSYIGSGNCYEQWHQIVSSYHR